jgi:hypothetical protein
MDDARQPRPDPERPDGSLELPDGPAPDDPSAGAPGNFVDDDRAEQRPDPGLEIPDGPAPEDPGRGADRAP